MNLTVDDHGGCCCGILHLYGFEYLNYDSDALHELNEIWEMDISDHPRLLIEVVLTDDQIVKLPKTVARLKKLKFRLVSRVKNPNTGNFINVLHRMGNYRAQSIPKLLRESPYN